MFLFFLFFSFFYETVAIILKIQMAMVVICVLINITKIVDIIMKIVIKVLMGGTAYDSTDTIAHRARIPSTNSFTASFPDYANYSLLSVSYTFGCKLW